MLKKTKWLLSIMVSLSLMISPLTAHAAPTEGIAEETTEAVSEAVTETAAVEATEAAVEPAASEQAAEAEATVAESGEDDYRGEEDAKVIFDQDIKINQQIPEEIVDFTRPYSNESVTEEQFAIHPEEATDLMNDQARAAYASRQVIAGRASDYIAATGEAVLYKLDIQPGIYLQAQLKQPINAAVDYDLYILDAEGYILAGSEYLTSINGTNGTLAEAVGYVTEGSVTATYYLYVLSSQGGSVSEAFTLEYSVSNACDNFEIDENARQAVGFTFGANGAISNSRNISSPVDNDWYVINIPVDKAYEKLALTVTTPSANKCGVEVYRNTASTGYKMVKQNLDSNKLTVSSGTYYVRIFNLKTLEEFNDADIQNYEFEVIPILKPDTIVITDLSGTEGLNHVVSYGAYGKHFRTAKGTLTVSGYVTATDGTTGELLAIPYTSVNAEYYNPHWDANNTPDFAYIRSSGLTDSYGKFAINLGLPSAVGANMFDAPVSYHYFDVCQIGVRLNDNNYISDNETIFHFAYSIWHG